MQVVYSLSYSLTENVLFIVAVAINEFYVHNSYYVQSLLVICCAYKVWIAKYIMCYVKQVDYMVTNKKLFINPHDSL